MLSEQFSLVEHDFDGGSEKSSDHGSWTHVTQELLRRFLTDDVLRQAQDAVTRAEKSGHEDESKCAERMSKTARLCRNVFYIDQLVNYYI